MLRFVLSTTLLLATAWSAQAAYCNGSPQPGERTSDFPIFDSPLKFVKSVKNAMLFTAGPANAPFDVVHVWGTPYEVGFAQGELLKPTVIAFVKETWSYLKSSLVQALDGDKLPQWLKTMIAEQGMERALDWSAKTTAPFTPQAYFDELHGLADATGLDYDLLLRLNMFPELTKAQCSFFGAWGTAVGTPGNAYQLRALDFDTTGPFKDYPQVTVYHPSEGHAWAQVGFPGNVGVLTGFSDQHLAISEIGVSYPDDTFGQGTDNTPPEKVHGEPWMYILRDTLQASDNLAEAVEHIKESNRTCNLIIGVGSGKDQHAYGIQFSGYVANAYDDTNMQPVNSTWHVPVEDVVYNGMDWLCPGYNSVLGEQLTKYHGQLNEDVIVHNLLPTTQTGDLHAAVFDLVNANMHVSFCRRSSSDASEPEYAYQRQFTRLHMSELFAQQKPV